MVATADRRLAPGGGQDSKSRRGFKGDERCCQWPETFEKSHPGWRTRRHDAQPSALAPFAARRAPRRVYSKRRSPTWKLILVPPSRAECRRRRLDFHIDRPCKAAPEDRMLLPQRAAAARRCRTPAWTSSVRLPQHDQAPLLQAETRSLHLILPSAASCERWTARMLSTTPQHQHDPER